MAWVRAAIDRNLRTALQKVLLWADRLEAQLEEAEGAATPARSTARRLREELEISLGLVNELVALAGPPSGSRDRPWPRAIVVADLMEAAVSTVKQERTRKGVELDCRVDGDLRVVAEPSWTLEVVEALLRAGIRATPPREMLRVHARRGEASPDASEERAPPVLVELRMPPGDLASRSDLDALTRGQPWRSPHETIGPVAMSVACAGCYAGLIGADLTLSEEGDELLVVLTLPPDRDPERREGWIA